MHALACAGDALVHFRGCQFRIARSCVRDHFEDGDNRAGIFFRFGCHFFAGIFFVTVACEGGIMQVKRPAQCFKDFRDDVNLFLFLVWFLHLISPRFMG